MFLDFGGETVDQRLWKTNRGFIILIEYYVPDKKIWVAAVVSDDGEILHPQVVFNEDGENSQFGSLMTKKRGHSQINWPPLLPTNSLTSKP